MTLDTLKQILLGGGGVLLVLMTILQIAPIKINPWSRLGRCIGRAINGEVISKVDKLSADLDGLKKECDERNATLCRTHILRFSDEILHGVLHSYEHYQQLMVDIDTYESYCSQHPEYKNNIALVAIEHIRTKYQEHLRDDSFL